MVTRRDVGSLRSLAVRLARECFFGDDLMESASPSGKGGAWCGADEVRCSSYESNQIHYPAMG